jgi:hypothetical protein
MKTTLLTFFVILFTIITSCEKKKTGTVKTTSTGASLHTNIFDAKVDGFTWQSDKEGFSTSKSSLFYFEGKTSNSNPYSSVSFNMVPTTTIGVNVLGTSTCVARYRDTLGYYFTAKTGTFNIIAIDTFKYGYKALKGSFSFMTDTISGKFHSVTNGVVDFKL